MNCSGCGFEVQSGFAFCPKCGARQPIACTDCGFPCAPDFAFCPKCGTAVAGAAKVPGNQVDRAKPAPLSPQPRDAPRPVEGRQTAEADRRQVTVLFADLSGFTTLSERLDPEDMQALQNQLFEEMTAAVARFGGFVDKFIGDAMLALFGAPVAHEDDPERALRAAIDMIDRSGHVSERVKARLTSPLTLHIGVNTGHVVAGGIGSGDARSYSVTGDTVNVAQRLQSMASPGEVLVGPLTWRLTRHAFAFESLGEAALRGKSGSVLVNRLRGPLDAPRAARGLETLGLSAPLIGREAEFNHLIGCLGLACGGSPQLVRLIGEAGIGKTRLIDELLARAGQDPAFATVAVRRAVCSPLGEQTYGALAAVLRSAYQIDRNASTPTIQTRLLEALSELGLSGGEIKELAPLYLHVLGLSKSDAALHQVEPAQLRRQIFFAIRILIERRLAQSPLLIIVEDLHWADAVSLEALRFVMDRLESSRLMLLFTHRPMAENDRLASNRINQSALRLAPLGLAEGKELLAALLGHQPVQSSRDLCVQILERSGGNPLFIEEIIRGLVDVGVVEREGAEWRVTKSDAAADIPASVQALLLARLDRLPRDVRTLAQEAAVIGPRFDASLLRAIAVSSSDVDTGLDILCDAEVIEEVAGARSIPTQSYRFTQTLLHDVIYQNLLVQRRTDLHGRIGATLERLCGSAPERLENAVQLGHHFGLSANRIKGADYLKVAADRARATYANEDAIRLYQQALAILPADDAMAERLTLRERIADLSGSSGGRDVAHEHYQVVLKACRAAGDRVGAARLLRKIGRSLWEGGRHNQAEEHYTEAAALLQGTNAPVEQAHLMQERGRLAFRLGDHVAAARWADDALSHVRGVPAEVDESAGFEAARAQAEALNTKGVALARLGRSRDAVQEVERSVAAAEAAGLLSAACRGYNNLGVLYSIIDPARAIEVCQQGLDVARRIGDLGYQARLLANLAVASCTFTNRCAVEGIPAAQKAVEIDRALDQREHLPVPLIVLGQIHQCHGDPTMAVRYFNEALQVAQETGEPQQLFPCYDGLATVNLDQGNMQEAERYFALAQDVCSRHGLAPETLIVLPFLD
jgi:adenylate cyclase